jgi:NADH-quinone oxidoreductase subunit N
MAINSVIGAYYYIRLIVVMYMREPSPEIAATAPARFPLSVNIVLFIAASGTIFLGLLPSKTLNYLLQSTLINR